MPVRRLPLLAALALACACLAGACLATPAGAEPAKKPSQKGVLGLGMPVAFSAEFGSAVGHDSQGEPQRGIQAGMRIEGGGYFLMTPIGNLGGIEGGFQMVYDGVGGGGIGEPLLDLPGPLLDVSLGFPITLYTWADAKEERFRLALAPGLGLTWTSTYAYLRLRAAARLTDALDAELSWRWLPAEVNRPFGDGDERLNAAALKGTVYWRRPETGVTGNGGWLGFVEYSQGQIETEGPATPDPAVFDGQTPFGVTRRQVGPQVLTIGVGYAM